MATTTLDVDKIMRAGQEVVRRAAQQFAPLLAESLQPEIDRLGRVLREYAVGCDEKSAELNALEKRVQDATKRATAAEERARAKEDAETAIDGRIESKQAKEKELDARLATLRGAITTAAAAE